MCQASMPRSRLISYLGTKIGALSGSLTRLRCRCLGISRQNGKLSSHACRRHQGPAALFPALI